jgi:hypothetical protein
MHVLSACAVWMPLSETCKQALESWQYRAAKIVIKTRMNIPKAALLLELGGNLFSTLLMDRRSHIIKGS